MQTRRKRRKTPELTRPLASPRGAGRRAAVHLVRSSDPRPGHLVVGHLNKAHGTKGELFVWSLTDYPDSHFAPGIVHLPGDQAGQEPSKSLAPLEIETIRPYRRGFLAKFVGVDDRDGAEALRGRYLFRPFESIDPLAEGEVFYHDLLGAEVVTSDGSHVGNVQEVYPVKPAELLRIDGPRGEVLVPMVPAFVREFQHKARRIVLDPPAGLLP